MRSALLRHASARRLAGGASRHPTVAAPAVTRSAAGQPRRPLALQSRPLAFRSTMSSPMGGQSPAAPAAPAGSAADPPPSLTYVAQYAVSGRAACQGCKLKIDKGALRVGTRSMRGDHGTANFHFY